MTYTIRRKSNKRNRQQSTRKNRSSSMRGGGPLEDVSILKCIIKNIINNIPELNTRENIIFLKNQDFRGLNDALLKTEKYKEAITRYNTIYGDSLEYKEGMVTAMLHAFNNVEQDVYNTCLTKNLEAIRQQNVRAQSSSRKRSAEPDDREAKARKMEMALVTKREFDQRNREIEERAIMNQKYADLSHNKYVKDLADAAKRKETTKHYRMVAKAVKEDR